MKSYPLSNKKLEDAVLQQDKQDSKHYGSCAVGEKALYLGSRFIDRRYYIPIHRIRRAYKKIAMSKGGFTGKGVFGSIAYLVVEYDDTKYECTFKCEDYLDLMLADIRVRHPAIKTISAAAERRLAKAEEERQARKKKNLSKQDLETIAELTEAREYLERRLDLCTELSSASKAKRVYDQSNPAYKWVALAIVLGGAIATVFGAYTLLTGTGNFGLYFLLLGGAALLFFSGANVLPTAKNNRIAIEQRLSKARSELDAYVSIYSGFPIPSRYAHPASLTRMIRSVEEGRADTVEEAYEDLKKGLKALNSSTSVDQEEYDEVMSIKPMFLLENYL